MGRVATRSKVSPSEYLAWEREQASKHEFFDGEVFAMAGGSPRHNALSVAVGSALRQALQRGCATMSSDQRVGVEADRYVYPDVSVVCGPVELQANTRDVIVNPQIIVEVLSQSTEQYDRGLKWETYQTIASLTDYLLVSQVDARIEQFRRDGDRWTYRAFGPGERIELTGGATLDVDAIFAGVFDLPGD
jgi:Uma2 family endonuclease